MLLLRVVACLVLLVVVGVSCCSLCAVVCLVGGVDCCSVCV